MTFKQQLGRVQTKINNIKLDVDNWEARRKEFYEKDNKAFAKRMAEDARIRLKYWKDEERVLIEAVREGQHD